jgi:hypothetical protein
LNVYSLNRKIVERCKKKKRKTIEELTPPAHHTAIGDDKSSA